MNEMKASKVFKGGGMNVTGLNILDSNSKSFKNISREFAMYQKSSQKALTKLTVRVFLRVRLSVFACLFVCVCSVVFFCELKHYEMHRMMACE